MVRKFKIGDIIRISDVTDPNYDKHSMWRVEGFTDKGSYILFSLKRKEPVDSDHVEAVFVPNFNKHNNENITGFNEFVDKYYRLVTETEYVLYGPK